MKYYKRKCGGRISTPVKNLLLKSAGAAALAPLITPLGSLGVLALTHKFTGKKPIPVGRGKRRKKTIRY